MLFALLLGAVLGFGERPVSDLNFAPSYAQSFAASNGRNFVAVSAMWRGWKGQFIRTRFDRDGKVVDDATIWSSANWWYSASELTGLATDGERFLAGLTDDRGALLLDGDGNLLRFIPTPRTAGVASNGSGFAIALASPHAVQLLDRDGTPNGEPIPMPDDIRAIADDGDGYILVLATSVRTLHRGVLSEPIAVPIDKPASASIASNGDVAMLALRSLGHTRLIPIVHGVAAAPRELGDDAASFGVIRAGTEFIVWYDSAGGTYAEHVNAGGEVLRRELVSPEHGTVAWNGTRPLFLAPYIDRFAEYQLEPSIATDGESVFVAWLEPSYKLRFATIGSDGSRVDAGSLDLGPSGFSHGAVAFDGRGWIIAYTTPRGIAFRQMMRDGSLGGETSVWTGACVDAVHAASSGDGHFVIVWEGAALLASIDGRPAFRITKESEYPDVTADGSVFHLVWSGITITGGLTFATLYRNGHLVINDQPAMHPSGDKPRVAGGFGLFFADYGRPIIRRGAIDVPLQIGQWRPDEVFWSAPGFGVDDAGNAVATLDSTAVLLGSDGRQSYVSVPGAWNTQVVHTRNGWVMVYIRFVDGPPYMRAPRVFVRSLDFTPSRPHP